MARANDTKTVATFLWLLKDANGTLKLNKCVLYTDPVEYLGHVIKPGRHKVPTRTKNAIVSMQEPWKVT